MAAGCIGETPETVTLSGSQTATAGAIADPTRTAITIRRTKPDERVIVTIPGATCSIAMASPM